MLNVMVLESEHRAADEAEQELADAGHVVLRCHEPGEPMFPCRGLVDASTCPLRSHVIDVALTVRSRVRSQPAPSEDGVRCALMSRVPLVVAGPRVLDPYDGLETRALDRTFDVVASCEEAATAGLGAYVRRADAAIAGTGDPKVRVTRIAGGLRVRVDGLDGVNSRECRAAVARIVGALRTFDRDARTIDVVVGDGTR
jgi:hypothetical protein